MSARAAVLLRILSGPYAGASMELAPGEWTLGNGEESHLLVADPSLRPHHLTLHISPDGAVRLLPHGDAPVVTASGQAVPAEGALIEPLVPLLAGTVCLAVGPAGTPWPDLEMPTFVAPSGSGAESPLQTAPAAQTAQAALSENGPLSAASPGSRGGTAGMSPGGTLPRPAPAAHAGGDSSHKKRVRPSRLLLILLAVVLLCGGSLAGIFSSGERSTQEIAQTLGANGFTQVTLLDDGRGGLSVGGTVPSNVQLDALAALLSAIAPEAAIETLSLESVVDILQARSSRADTALRISRVGGTIAISGYVYSQNALKALFAEDYALLDQVPLRLKIVTWEELSPKLMRLAQNRSIKGKLRIVPGKYRISVQVSDMTPREAENLSAFLREAESLVEETQPFVQDVWDKPTPAGILDAIAQPQILPSEAGQPPASETGRPPASEAEQPMQSAVDAPATEPEQAASGGFEIHNGEAAFMFGNWGQSDPGTLSIPYLAVLPASGGAGAPSVCGRLSLTGQGDSLAVRLGGSVYPVGARMPNGYQVVVIEPDFVVLRMGKTHIQFCPVQELGKETRP